MTIVALAVETNFSLNNGVENCETPKEAAQRFIKNLVLEEGEEINMILASVLVDDNTSVEEGQAFALEVERAFEAAMPLWFAEGYVCTE
jgi:hypothetical protein